MGDIMHIYHTRNTQIVGVLGTHIEWVCGGSGVVTPLSPPH